MPSASSNGRKILIILIPFIIATLIMFPRLSSPQFGFFDDARMLAQSKSFLQGDFSMSHDKQAGRFRPAYWLYYAAIYSIAGYHPFWFFVGQLFIFYILLYELRLILNDMGFSEPQVLATSLIFILTMPIIENFYTLSKGEPLQLVFILAAITFSLRGKPQNKYDLKRILLSALCILIAIMIKETAIVMLPIFFLWGVINLFAYDPGLKKDLRLSISLFVAAIFAVVSYFLLRNLWGATALLGGTYTDRYLVETTSLIQKLLRWSTQFAFYFHYLLPLILVVLLLFFFYKDSLTNKEKKSIFIWSIWSLLWYGILIPWEYAELYYLLPFGFGVSILIGIILPPILRSINANQKIKHYSISVLSILAGILFIFTLPNYITDAKTQLTFDRANQDMLDFITNYASEEASIYINIETSNEYSEKLEINLREHYQLNDITYGNINADRMEKLNEQTSAIILMPFIKNQPRLTVRAGVEETYQQPWNEKLHEKTEFDRETVKTFEESFRISNINLPVLLCPLLGQRGFCENPDPIIDNRLFVYGWEIYKIN
ncbi:MAG: hypothetical protein SVP52_06335 [Chloroflexota bacterium]|nr:hypothetical protein [Chloroflexota bacterium]